MAKKKKKKQAAAQEPEPETTDGAQPPKEPEKRDAQLAKGKGEGADRAPLVKTLSSEHKTLIHEVFVNFDAKDRGYNDRDAIEKFVENIANPPCVRRPPRLHM